MSKRRFKAWMKKPAKPEACGSTHAKGVQILILGNINTFTGSHGLQV